MTERDTFDLILESLNRAMLDAALWPRASALIEEACGSKGNWLAVAEASNAKVRVVSLGLYTRDRRREGLEREFLEAYHAQDEGIPRFRQLPSGQLVAAAALYSEEELKTSAAYNDFMRRSEGQRGLRVRLDGPEAHSHISWSIQDPVEAGGWGFAQTELIKRLLPHVRQFVAVRLMLTRAGAQSASLASLLDSRRIGVIHLDPSGKVVEANDRARRILRRGDGLSDRLGALRAVSAADRSQFDQLLAGALAPQGASAVGGSMRVLRSSGRPHYAVHVRPVLGAETDSVGRWRVAALVLIVDTDRPSGIDRRVVARTLGLTQAESEVASKLAEGMTVDQIAGATGRKRRSVYWLLERIYAKLGVRRQVDLVRQVLTVSDLG